MVVEVKSVRRFAGSELHSTDRVMRHLQSGGVAVVDGEWPEVCRLYDWLYARRDQLTRRGKERMGGRQWENARLALLDNLVVDGVDGLRPVRHLRQSEAALAQRHPVTALGGAELLADREVLAPRSQETLWLIRRAIEGCRASLPTEPRVLDMGCGSGVCALLAAQALGAKAQILATDHLPAAVATTRTNAERLGVANITAVGPGDLYEPVAGERFDLIIFNAPWVVAPAHNPAETALNDAGQSTVARFLGAAAAHLNVGGRVILGYADHSGPAAIERLEALIQRAGLVVEAKLSDRIRTHRHNRAWETVFAYVLR